MPSLSEHHTLLESEFVLGQQFAKMPRGKLIDKLELAKNRNKLLILKVQKLELEKQEIEVYREQSAEQLGKLRRRLEQAEQHAEKQKQKEQPAKDALVEDLQRQLSIL